MANKLNTQQLHKWYAQLKCCPNTESRTSELLSQAAIGGKQAAPVKAPEPVQPTVNNLQQV